MSEKKLTKGKNRVFWGVCSGMANYFGIDVTVVRILWVILSIFPGTIVGGIFIYLICGLLMPEPSEP